jgi:hypothetical protein
MIEPVRDLIFSAIEKHANSRPRSLQTMVGPSDLGDTCDHCLSAKLAGWQKRQELAWLPYIGTAVHEYLAHAFDSDEWISETSSMVGHVDGMPVWGTADLFHIPTRTVVDFKVVGQATLTAAKRGDVREQYQRQVHLYARGLEAKHVAIMFLPRLPALRGLGYPVRGQAHPGAVGHGRDHGECSHPHEWGSVMPSHIIKPKRDADTSTRPQAWSPGPARATRGHAASKAGTKGCASSEHPFEG